jgi:hypothetical protein
MTQLEDRVRAAIASNHLIGDGVRISVSADEIGTVTLRGTLPTHVQSRAAARAAHEVPEVFNVINEIAVMPLGQAAPADSRADEDASVKGEPSADLDSKDRARSENPDDELRELRRESRALEESEKSAETSISEELREEHWGKEPQNPPQWDKPGPPGESAS